MIGGKFLKPGNSLFFVNNFILSSNVIASTAYSMNIN